MVIFFRENDSDNPFLWHLWKSLAIVVWYSKDTEKKGYFSSVHLSLPKTKLFIFRFPILKISQYHEGIIALRSKFSFGRCTRQTFYLEIIISTTLTLSNYNTAVNQQIASPELQQRTKIMEVLLV